MRTYGAITKVSDGHWRITEIEPHVALRLKQIFPRIPRTGRLPFDLKGPEQLDADLQWFMQRYPLRISEADLGHMLAKKSLFEKGQSELAFLLSEGWKPSGAIAFREGERPYVYQAQAAELCQRKGGLLLMDDLGLGKTVSALATICDHRFLPALVVPPTHLVKQWVEKTAEFTHLQTHVFKSTTPYELPKADVYICPYSKLGGWIDYAERAPFQSIVFDEIQELRNGRGTSKGQAAWAFRQRVSLGLGLSATPIYNYGAEIFQIVEFISQGIFGSFTDFVTEWCTMGPGGKWVVKDPPALGTFLRENHVALRRTNEDVGKEYPPPNVLSPCIPYDERVIDDEAEALAGLARTVITGAFTERGKAAREFDLRMRRATGVAKAPHVANFVKILLEAGQPVLLLGWHREVYEIWLKKLAAYNPMLYTGTESPAQKERTKNAFISGKSNIMIMSLRSGAGLDGLQERCHTIVFGELDWSPKVHEQCVGRLRRPGQTKQVDVVYLHSDGGSDPSVLSVLGLKASQSHGIVDPMSAPADQHSDSTRIRQLAELFLAGKSHLAHAAEPPDAVETELVPEPQYSLLDVMETRA